MRTKAQHGRVIPFERDVEFFLKRGSMRLERNDLIEAISNYHIALEREPENVEIQLAIAEVLTQMHRFEQSNQFLFPMLSYDESPAECFFCIACNFLGLQEFTRAHESLESYLTLDPDGDFVSDALEMLDIIEDEHLLYTMPGIYLKDEREAHNACALGRQYLENGRIEDAVLLLDETQKAFPGLTFVSNNLALAHFCAKDFKRALEIVNAVLEEKPADVQAHCNLLLFLHAARDKEGAEQALSFLRNTSTQDPQDWNRMAVVFMEMGNMDEALATLKKLQQVLPYDESTLHRLGVCYYHLGKYAQSMACYDRLIKMDPYDTIAAYYRRLAWRASHDRIENVDWMYNYQVPYTELLRRVRELNRLNRSDYSELKRRWHGDKDFRALMMWSLKLPDYSTKQAMLKMIASFGGRDAELVLRRFELDQAQPDTVKKQVFAMLKHMGAAEPYIAYLDGNLVQSKVQLQHATGGVKAPVAYQRFLKTCLDNMQATRSSQCIMSAVTIFKKYVGDGENLPRLTSAQASAMAGALEYIACAFENDRAVKAQIAEAYGVSMARLSNAIDRIMDRLNDEGEA